MTPDLDVFFHDHRSPTHSLIVLGLVMLVFLASTWKRKTARSLVLLAGFGLLSHILLDLFQYSIPLLWPLLSQQFLWPDPNFNKTGVVISFVLLAPTIVKLLRVRLASLW